MFMWFLKNERECYYSYKTWLQLNLTVEEYSEVIQKFEAAGNKLNKKESEKRIKNSASWNNGENISFIRKRKILCVNRKEKLNTFHLQKEVLMMKTITTHSKKSFIWNTLIIKKNKKVAVDFFMAHLKRRWRF